MNQTTRLLAILALVFSVLWLVLMIAGMASAGPLTTLDAAISYGYPLRPLFVLTYLNAALVTLSASALFGGLYAFARPRFPIGAPAAFAFVPAYCAINLFVYLSQITLLPGLFNSAGAGDDTVLRLLAGQLIQAWPSSAVNFFNNLAYALLGIPSIVFGMALYQHGVDGGDKTLRNAGALLALNGIACIIGVVGILGGSTILSYGSVLGGVLFIAALVFMVIGKQRNQVVSQSSV